MIFAYDLIHKKQTKANDCWYACIQMLKTYKAGGVKTKTTGEAAMHLHKGVLGHTLLADSKRSKSFLKVLADNDLVCVCKQMYFNINAPDTVEDALRKYGPIMIGGMYGRLLKVKMGHFIVLAGIDTDRQLFKIYDPDQSKPDWRTYNRIGKDFWGNLYNGDDESALAIKRG